MIDTTRLLVQDKSQLNGPQGVFVDLMGTVYVADRRNHRIMRWCKGIKQGDVIIGGNEGGEKANQLNMPEGLSTIYNPIDEMIELSLLLASLLLFFLFVIIVLQYSLHKFLINSFTHRIFSILNE